MLPNGARCYKARPPAGPCARLSRGGRDRPAARRKSTCQLGENRTRNAAADARAAAAAATPRLQVRSKTGRLCPSGSRRRAHHSCGDGEAAIICRCTSQAVAWKDSGQSEDSDGADGGA